MTTKDKFMEVYNLARKHGLEIHCFTEDDLGGIWFDDDGTYNDHDTEECDGIAIYMPDEESNG